MRTGTKSLLFGVHNIIWHPTTVLIAWVKLYGRPDFNTFLCIFVHDWGYWGCEHMDDDRGQNHPIRAANMVIHFGLQYYYLCKYHSRHLAKNAVMNRQNFAGQTS